jgi:hypothetical protein
MDFADGAGEAKSKLKRRARQTKRAILWPSADSQKKALAVCFIYFNCGGGETRGWQF